MLMSMGLPTGHLDQVMRTAVHLNGAIPRAGHICGYMLDMIHWFPFWKWIIYSIAALDKWCLQDLVLAYLR